MSVAMTEQSFYKYYSEGTGAVKQGDKNTSILAEANNAFREGDYLKAHELYESLSLMDGVISKIAKQNLDFVLRKIRANAQDVSPSQPTKEHKNIKPILRSLRSSDNTLVIVYPIIPWGFRHQRPQQLVSRLSKRGYSSVYIATASPKQIPAGTIEILDSIGTRELSEGVHEIWLQAVSNFNMYKTEIAGRNLLELSRQLITLCGILEPSKVIHLVQFPGWTPLVKKMANDYGGAIIYDCMDHHAGFTNNTSKALSQEDQLIHDADLVLASSLLLEKQLSPKAKEVSLIKNATEYSHFSDCKPNGKLDFISGPIVGYYGAIADWFDIELIEECARLKPEWNFVLIGSTDLCDTSHAENLKNIFFIGEIPYTELPGYLYYFDVCTIPFKIIPLTEATNPVKFYEFISAGKQVVATSLPELKPYSSYVRFADEPEKFIKQISKALTRKDDPREISARKELASRNDWDDRVSKLLDLNVLAWKDGRTSYRFSIIIVTFNELESATIPCIQSILDNTPNGQYELIIVDNCSVKDRTPEYLTEIASRHQHIKIRLNQTNRGFSGGNNDGIAMATGEFIVLINNDTIVRKGWLQKLILPLLHDPKVGLIGPITNSAGAIQNIHVTSTEVNEVLSELEEYTSRNSNDVYIVNKLGFFCVALRASLLDEVGLLDESFGVGMFEDDELSHRVKSAGYKCAITEGCYVYHKGSASFSKLRAADYQSLFQTNKIKFKDLTGIDWGFNQIMQEYFDYYKSLIAKAKANPARACDYIQNMSLRMPAFEWLGKYLGEVEGRSGSVGNAALGYDKNVEPRHIPEAELLAEFGKLRCDYLAGRSIIIFPPTVDWTYAINRPQQLAKAFVSSGYAVIYLTCCTQSDAVDFYEITKEGVLVLNEGFISQLAHLVLPDEVTLFCCQLIERTYTESIPHSRYVYDVLSDVSMLQGHGEGFGIKQLDAIRHANLVTVSSLSQFEDIRKVCDGSMLLVQNAVSEHFIVQAKFYRSSSANQMYRDAPGQKIVGCVGSIAEWMDFGLIEILLKSFSDVKFAFVGQLLPGGFYMNNLSSTFNNLCVESQKTDEELPGVIAQFDVCIIPYLLNRFTHAISPTELFEYAALGKPIVTTAMRECLTYAAVMTAISADDFVAKLRMALEISANSPHDAVLKLATDNTWQSRAERILKQLL
jgi:GT2 family glycosyltransferase